MTAHRAGCVAAVAVMALAGVARAEPRTTAKPAAPAVAAAASSSAASDPDPAVQRVAEANLESTADRRGLTFEASVGGGLIVGVGINDSVGRGGAVTLRLGHVATPRTVIAIEVGATLAFHKPATMSATEHNTNTNVLVSARHYVNPSLWVRAGGGLGIYVANGVLLSDGSVGELELIGPAVLGGVGIDVARFKWAVMYLDVAASAMINREGVLAASSLNVGLAFD